MFYEQGSARVGSFSPFSLPGDRSPAPAAPAGRAAPAGPRHRPHHRRCPDRLPEHRRRPQVLPLPPIASPSAATATDRLPERRCTRLVPPCR
jgi:hypothetical protein